MKSFIKNMSLPLICLAAMPLFTACSDSKDFGETLFPTEQEDYATNKAYIMLNDEAQQSTAAEVVQNPMGYDIPDYTVEAYVCLTKPADADITVTVAPDADAAAMNKGDHKVMPVDAFIMERGTVTIKAGQTKSDEPVVARLQDNDATKSMATGDQGKMAFVIKDISGNAVKSKNYNTINGYVSYSYSALKKNGSVEGKTKLAIENVFNFGWQRDDTSTLTDGSYTNSKYTYKGYGGWRVTLSEPTEISAVAVYPRNSSNYFNYAPKSYELSVSDDGLTWTSVGTAKSAHGSLTSFEPLIAELYTPVTAKYLKVDPISAFYENTYYIYVSEIEAYK